MPPHHLINFEMKRYYQNELKLNGVYSRNNFPKIKDGEYVINLDEYISIGNHWVAINVKNDVATYFDGFGVEYIRRDIKKFRANKIVKGKIYGLQAFNEVKDGSLDFPILFSPSNLKK